MRRLSLHCNQRKDLARNMSLEESELYTRQGRIHKYRKHSIIFTQGDPPGNTFVVESGMIRTYFTSQNGKEFTKGFWSKYDVIGAPDIFGHDLRLISAEAVEDSVLKILSYEDLDILIARIPRFAHNLISVLSCNIRSVTTTSDWLGTQPVLARVALTILLQSEWHGRRTEDGQLCLTHLTHEHIALLVGATRQWVTHTLAELEDTGAIKCKKRSIIIYDEEKLEDIANL